MSSNAIDAALALPPDHVVATLCALPEDQWFERKSARIKPKDFAVTLVAMGNAEGGTIVVGLSDGRAETPTPQVLNDLRQAPLDFTAPPVRTHFSEVAHADGALLVARVDPGGSVHEHVNGECYLRVGDESRKLTFAQRQELHYDRGESHFDGKPLPGLIVRDLDQEQVGTFREATGSRTDEEHVLRARGLLGRSGEVTVAAWLLFAHLPQTELPHAHVRVLRYTENERGSGAGLTLDDERDRRVEGSIPRMIHDAAEITDRWVPKRRALGPEGRFTGVPLVPRDAWLEGLVNAVVHRSYSMAGDHIRMEIFPNRIEITSPGRFPGLVDTARPLDISRYARNPRIARTCADLRIGQELGEGIRRMFDEMATRGLRPPMYRQSSGAVHLTLSALKSIDDDVLAALPRGAEALLDVLRAAGRPLSTGEILESAGSSRPTVTKQLASLRQHGLVAWSGRSARDPRAAWSVA